MCVKRTTKKNIASCSKQNEINNDFLTWYQRFDSPRITSLFSHGFVNYFFLPVILFARCCCIVIGLCTFDSTIDFRNLTYNNFLNVLLPPWKSRWQKYTNIGVMWCFFFTLSKRLSYGDEWCCVFILVLLFLVDVEFNVTIFHFPYSVPLLRVLHIHFSHSVIQHKPNKHI